MKEEKSLIELLQDKALWQETFQRMSKKKNFQLEDKLYLDILANSNWIEDSINSILSGKYKWGIPKKVEIQKPGTTKVRVVYIHGMLDRVVLNVLYRTCTKYFRKEVNEHVFSYLPKVKTSDAVKSLTGVKGLKNKYAVKLDISSYFNSVSESALHNAIDNLFNNIPVIHKLVNDLLFTNKVLYKGDVIDEYMSLIPGSAFSSFLANYILRDIDKYIIETFGTNYARYSDDLIIFHRDEKVLDKIVEHIQEQLSQYGLTVNPSKFEYYNPGDPITFLGLIFSPIMNSSKYKIDIGKPTFVRMKRIIKSIAKEARLNVSLRGKDPYKEVAKAIDKINTYTYKSFILDETVHGWACYVYSNVNCIDTLQALDFYMKDTLRPIITGKNNKANCIKVPESKLKELGYISFVEMFNIYHIDYDYYRNKIATIEPIFIQDLEKVI